MTKYKTLNFVKQSNLQLNLFELGQIFEATDLLQTAGPLHQHVWVFAPNVTTFQEVILTTLVTTTGDR